MQPIEEEVAVDLRFDEDEINEQDDIIMLDVFICKSFAPWALCQSHVAPCSASFARLDFCSFIPLRLCFFAGLCVAASQRQLDAFM